MKTELEHAFGRAFGRRDVTSPRMQAAIREWFDLYFGRAFPGEDPADRLPVLIVSKLCRAVFAEYESRLRPGGAKTDWMTGNLRALDAVRGRAMQAALVGGECLLKPVPAGAGFEFVPVRRIDEVLPRAIPSLSGSGRVEEPEVRMPVGQQQRVMPALRQ